MSDSQQQLPATVQKSQPVEAQPVASGTIRASWPFSLDDIRANTARYPLEARDALVAAFRWCIDPMHPLSKPDFARRVGASDNLIYKLYTGKYRTPDGSPMDPSPDLVKAIHDFLEVEKERFDLGAIHFVLTPTARKIHNAADLARESQTVVFMWGPSHIGKTWALEQYASSNNHGRTIYCRLRAASGLGGMIRRIADACGISDKNCTANLIDRIKRGLSPSTLLVLDECHLLAHTYRKGSFHNCMEVIRELHDESKCGLLLCFTILDDVRAASQKELQQLWRRGVHKVPLPIMPTKADLAAILAHNGLQFPERELAITVRVKTAAGKREDIVESPYEVLRQVSKVEGLKAITERIRYARKLAAREGGKLSWNSFIEAHLRIAKQFEQEGEWQ